MNSRPAKDTVFNLRTHLGKYVRVEIYGGRQGKFQAINYSIILPQVNGVLRGYDALTNLVLDDATEDLIDSKSPQSKF